MLFAAPKLHQAVIFRQGVEPAPEISDLMGHQFGDELFENLHHGILGRFRCFQIFQAYPVNKFHIPAVQLCQYFKVSAFAVLLHQFGVTGARVRYRAQESQLVRVKILLRKIF